MMGLAKQHSLCIEQQIGGAAHVQVMRPLLAAKV